MKHWKRWTVFFWIAALALALPGQESLVTADAPAEVTLESPPLVALTFDDGPRSSTTGPLLDGLALREVPATFFLVGSRIPGNEDLLQRMAAEGHQIGIHTYDHVVLQGLSRQEFERQLGKTRELIVQTVGEGSYWLRPPYGLMDKQAEAWCGSPIVLWSVDPEDWKDENVDRIVAAVTAQVSDGAIILMHDLFPSSVEAALRVVDELSAQGYCFVTVEQLLEERGIVPSSGQAYRQAPPPETVLQGVPEN